MDKLTSILAVVSALVASVGCIISVLQWNSSQKMDRADRVYGLIGLIRTDNDIRSILYKIDYSENWYNEDFHSGVSGIESQVDRTFTYFSYICYLESSRVLNEDEFRFFEYHIDRILKNEDSINYLYNIYHWSNKFGIPCSFSCLCDYGRKKGLLDEAFFDPKSWKDRNNCYFRNLNF